MVILEAAVEELADVGYGGVTIESIAARAGVGKSTIYRHWPDKLALIADAFETFHVQMVPDLGDRTARESVELLLGHVAEVVLDSTWSRCIPALIEGAERDPRVRAFHHRYNAERRQALIDLIARGIDAGEFRSGARPRARDGGAARRDLLPPADDRRAAAPGRRRRVGRADPRPATPERTITTAGAAARATARTGSPSARGRATARRSSGSAPPCPRKRTRLS